MSPQEFIAKWGPGGPSHFLNEEQGAQSHFLDLCELLGVSKPGTVSGYRFEERGEVIGGHSGYADVFMRNHFAWENKAPGKNLDAALKQLLTYSLALENPPLLVVSEGGTAFSSLARRVEILARVGSCLRKRKLSVPGAKGSEGPRAQESS